VILDSSAVLAILYAEPELGAFAQAIEDAAVVRISASNYLEASIVLNRNPDPVVRGRLDTLLREFGVIIEPFTAEQARIGREAYRDFGKRSGHPAQLNFGDCFAYALAKTTGEPLLFKGADFVHTDVQPALPPSG
jgi:ribonuclease VapC